MMYCIKCGKEIPEDSNFCKHCGANQTVKATVDKQGKNEVVYFEVSRDNFAYISKLLFRAKEPIFSQIKQKLDVYVHKAIKEKFYDDYLRKCDIRNSATGNELICNGGSSGYGRWVYEGLMSIFDQLEYDMRVESRIPILWGGSSSGEVTFYRGTQGSIKREADLAE